MGMLRALGVVAILLFFMTLSFMTIQLDQSFPDIDSEMAVTNLDVEQFNENLINNTGDLGTSTLNAWDYLARFIDIVFVGIVFFKNGALQSVVNVFILFPIRIMLLWFIVEMFRGN